MYEEITLLKYIDDAIDENGFEVEAFEEMEIFAEKKSIRSNEYYEAQKQGYKLSAMFVIKPYEYDGQEYLVYEGHKYKVERSYEKDSEKLELICSRII